MGIADAGFLVAFANHGIAILNGRFGWRSEFVRHC